MKAYEAKWNKGTLWENRDKEMNQNKQTSEEKVKQHKKYKDKKETNGSNGKKRHYCKE